MSRSFGRFFGKMKRLLDTSALFGFSFYLLVGLLVAILFGQSFYKVFARPNLDLDRFDPDIKPAIEVLHNPPLIAKFDEEINLKFNFVCGYVSKTGTCCKPNATLFVSYGNKDDFSPIPLMDENQDSLRILSANISAVNEDEGSLRYYLQVNDPQVGLNIRYPVEGTIDLFSVKNFISVDLPTQKLTEHGELVLALPWGNDLIAVGLQKRDGYPTREGPLAMDVAEDGRIALLDFVNKRVLVYDPKDRKFSSIPLPFTLKNQGDVQFDQYGQIAVLDPVGETIDQSTTRIPQLYRLLPDGQINAATSVFASIPAWLTRDLKVIDLDYSKVIVPFNPLGDANSREAQRQKQPAALLAKYMINSVHDVRLADTLKGIAFSVRSASPLGAITYFGTTPQGYIVIFEGDQIRAVWFDASGMVLQDITLPRDDYSEVNSKGRMAVDSQGSLYVMESTEKGIEIRFVKSP